VVDVALLVVVVADAVVLVHEAPSRTITSTRAATHDDLIDSPFSGGRS
jgi:hypothetical protein